MKQCSNCGNFTWNNGFTPMPDICVQCKFVEIGDDAEPCNWKPQPMTNADRIRAMTNEELAKWYCENVDCAVCKAAIGYCNGENSVLNWLQQPCGGADHEKK